MNGCAYCAAASASAAAAAMRVSASGESYCDGSPASTRTALCGAAADCEGAATQQAVTISADDGPVLSSGHGIDEPSGQQSTWSAAAAQLHAGAALARSTSQTTMTGIGRRDANALSRAGSRECLDSGQGPPFPAGKSNSSRARRAGCALVHNRAHEKHPPGAGVTPEDATQMARAHGQRAGDPVDGERILPPSHLNANRSARDRG